MSYFAHALGYGSFWVRTESKGEDNGEPFDDRSIGGRRATLSHLRRTVGGVKHVDALGEEKHRGAVVADFVVLFAPRAIVSGDP